MIPIYLVVLWQLASTDNIAMEYPPVTDIYTSQDNAKRVLI